MFTGYTLIPESVSSSGNRFIVVPTIGLDYTYKFNHKIGLVWANDIELSTYVVEKDNNEELKREYAFVTALMFLYEPLSWWSVFAGPGYEFEAHENFILAKIGTEFIKNFDDGWSVGLAASLDIKEVNTSPSIGITVTKGLSKPK